MQQNAPSLRKKRKRCDIFSSLPVTKVTTIALVLLYFIYLPWRLQNLRNNDEEHFDFNQNRMGGKSWIPEKDVNSYLAKLKKTQQKSSLQKSTTSNENVSSHLLYMPNLNQYPLTLLKNTSFSEKEEEEGVIIVPFFWHVPKAAGTTVKNIMTHCYGLTRAQRIQHPQSLQVINGVLNMDTHTVAGITASKRVNIISHNHSNALVSSLLHEASTLFTSNTHHGQLFTIIRHPIHTSASLFYYLSAAKWEDFYDAKLGNLTLGQYAQSDKMVDNWMVRYLSHEEQEDVTLWHLEFAKALMESKFVIGLYDDLKESIHRFQFYFDWNDGKNATKCVCHRMKHLYNKNEHKEVVKGSDDWKLLLEKNKYDMELYEFAVDLYERQGRTIFKNMSEKEDGFDCPKSK